MGYMRWAKTHRRVRYELTGSGAPPAAPTDLAAHLASSDLEVKGPYGDPRLIDAVAGRYAVPTGGVVPVVGASSGVFIALAVAVGQGDSAIIEHPSYDPLTKSADFLGVEVTNLLRRADAGFAVPLEALKTGLSRGARAVVLTNLHNPSGQSLSEDTFRHIADCCAVADATLIVDEAYLDGTHLVAGRRPWTAANLGDDDHLRVIH